MQPLICAHKLCRFGVCIRSSRWWMMMAVMRWRREIGVEGQREVVVMNGRWNPNHAGANSNENHHADAPMDTKLILTC